MVKVRRATRRMTRKARKTRVRRMSGGGCKANDKCLDSPTGKHSFGEKNSAGRKSCYHCYCYEKQ